MKKESVIHIDSRHRNNNSTSSSNMTVNLEHGFYIYDHASIQIKSVHIPNTLKTINRDVNDKLYYTQNHQHMQQTSTVCLKP